MNNASITWSNNPPFLQEKIKASKNKKESWRRDHSGNNVLAVREPFTCIDPHTQELWYLSRENRCKKVTSILVAHSQGLDFPSADNLRWNLGVVSEEGLSQWLSLPTSMANSFLGTVLACAGPGSGYNQTKILIPVTLRFVTCGW